MVFRNIATSLLLVFFVSCNSQNASVKNLTASEFEKGISQTEFFSLQKNINGVKATSESAQKAVAEGKFMMGIIVLYQAKKP